MHVLRFSVADATYAVAIDRVVEIAPRVLMTPLPDAPRFVEGVFSFRQRACVAVSLRRRLGHPERAAALDEHVVVVHGRKRLLGLVVDRVAGDEVIAEARIELPEATSKLVAGIVPLVDGILLIQDVDALLTDDEEQSVDASLAS